MQIELKVPKKLIDSTFQNRRRNHY